MRKRDRERFVRKANALIESLGAEQVDGYWHLDTNYGKLRLRVDGDQSSGVGTVFTRFDDPQRAREHVSCNPHSGKWNHHYFDPWGVDQAIDDLEYHLKLVFEVPRNLYQIRVHQDGSDKHTDYRITATNEIDARVIAFCLDGGMVSGETDLDAGHVELAKTWTEALP